MDLLNFIITKKSDEVENQIERNSEYQKALRIPRQHYKMIEKLKYEELMVQRDEIIKKFSRKFGVDADQALRMMVMPDPNLPPEKQMELVSGGALS